MSDIEFEILPSVSPAPRASATPVVKGSNWNEAESLELVTAYSEMLLHRQRNIPKSLVY